MINRNLKNRDILDVYYKNENDKKEHKYRCYNPETAISPKWYSYLETIHNGSHYVIARIEKCANSPQVSTLMKLLYPLGYTLRVMPIDKKK